ncbi:uncharacterized protein LOC114977090 [Acropora millepora]|uniref:uncharacterized protein LOC114977090 n=1 Tax=Acropora millepora TaxID=45264 RepID=UPI001CF203E9|nr:uncharacterized protein LOC114977090 [Acropora millepora]XP_044168652.1 uncharacterized protein LOC114977090 [Acropora millepora]
MARQFWLEVILLVVVSLVLGSRGSRKDSGTKPLDDLLEKIADGLAKHDKCKNFNISDCTITEDCLQLTCSKKVLDKEISLKMKVNRCEEPVTVTIDVKVENVEWSHVFTSGDEVPVPGLTLSAGGLVKAGLYVKVKLQEGDGKLTLKVALEAKAKIGSLDRTSSIASVSKELPIETAYCGLVRWWYDKDTAVRISVTITFLLVALFVITFGCFCGCCCCCKPCKKRSNRVI